MDEVQERPNIVRNPATGRWISINGPVYRKLAREGVFGPLPVAAARNVETPPELDTHTPPPPGQEYYKSRDGTYKLRKRGQRMNHMTGLRQAAIANLRYAGVPVTEEAVTEMVRRIAAATIESASEAPRGAAVSAISDEPAKRVSKGPPALRRNFSIAPTSSEDYSTAAGGFSSEYYSASDSEDSCEEDAQQQIDASAAKPRGVSARPSASSKSTVSFTRAAAARVTRRGHR